MRIFYRKSLLVALLIFVSSNINCQDVSSKMCESFLASSELYVIESDLSTMNWEYQNGGSQNAVEMVQKYWPNKKVISIGLDDFNALEDINSKFHFFMGSFTMESGANYSAIDFMAIQKGKTGRSPSKVVYYIYVDIKDLLATKIGQRVENGIHSMQTIIDNHEDKSERSSKLYKAANYKSFLESKTLYIRTKNVSEKLKDKATLAKAYPHRIKLISEEEWVEIVTQKRKDALYIEYIDGTNEALDIYDAETGIQIISTYPWFKLHADYLYDKKFFSKIK